MSDQNDAWKWMQKSSANNALAFAHDTDRGWSVYLFRKEDAERVSCLAAYEDLHERTATSLTETQFSQWCDDEKIQFVNVPPATDETVV